VRNTHLALASPAFAPVLEYGQAISDIVKLVFTQSKKKKFTGNGHKAGSRTHLWSRPCIDDRCRRDCSLVPLFITRTDRTTPRPPTSNVQHRRLIQNPRYGAGWAWVDATSMRLSAGFLTRQRLASPRQTSGGGVGLGVNAGAAARCPVLGADGDMQPSHPSHGGGTWKSTVFIKNRNSCATRMVGAIKIGRSSRTFDSHHGCAAADVFGGWLPTCST